MTHPESKLLFTPLMSWKSFPSDHGMSAWLAVFFALLIGFPLVFPLVILALWVSWGRVYAGVHYPIDIFGGAAVAGFVIACFYFLI
jgi:undecaprenyl-diphosphatase